MDSSILAFKIRLIMWGISLEFSVVKITVLKKLKTGEILKEYGVGEVEAGCPYVKQRHE